MSKPSRNDSCPCGSGKKYKHCHLGSSNSLNDSPTRRDPIPLIIVGVGSLGGLATMGMHDVQSGIGVFGGGLLLALVYYILRDPPSSKGGGDPGAINFGG